MQTELEKSRNQMVVKSNDLIRKARYNLTVNQQKIIAYVISLIKPTDKELMMYEISVAEFCDICGIEKAFFYDRIKDVFLALDKKSFLVETDEKIFNFRWFSEFEYIKGTGTIRLQLNSNIKSYLLNMSKDFTQYELFNILALKGKYSIRLYEWFKSYSFLAEKKIEINELKTILIAENYTEFKPFRRRVIEPAIEEINKYTDILVSYEKVTKGKSVDSLIFYIKRKPPLDRYNIYLQINEKLNKRDHNTEGQISMFDLSEEYFKDVDN